MALPASLQNRPVSAPPSERPFRAEHERNGALASPSLSDLAMLPQAGAELRRLGLDDLAWEPVRDAGKVLFVREGLVRVYQKLDDSRQRLVQLVGAGHWAGVEGLAGTSASRTRIVAAEPSQVLIVDATRLIQLVVAEPDAARDLIRQLARSASALHAQLTETTLLDCESQLVHTLLRLSRCGGATTEGTQVILRVTQQDIADALGVARETVNGMLQRLSTRHLISKRRGKVSFDLVQLEQYAAQVTSAGKGAKD